MTTELLNLNECLHLNTTIQPIPTQQPNNDSLSTVHMWGYRRLETCSLPGHDKPQPNTNCPSGWNLTSYSKRTCGKFSTGSTTCDSVNFTVSGGDYTRVCGRIIAYQNSQIDGYETYHDGVVTTIDGAYVSGVRQSSMQGNDHTHWKTHN